MPKGFVQEVLEVFNEKKMEEQLACELLGVEKTALIA
jgi:hypothetical protein